MFSFVMTPQGQAGIQTVITAGTWPHGPGRGTSGSGAGPGGSAHPSFPGINPQGSVADLDSTGPECWSLLYTPQGSLSSEESQQLVSSWLCPDTMPSHSQCPKSWNSSRWNGVALGCGTAYSSPISLETRGGHEFKAGRSSPYLRGTTWKHQQP